jgi:hypothetical protein
VAILEDSSVDEAAILADVIAAIRLLPPESRQRLIDTIATFFSTKPSTSAHNARPIAEARPSPSSFGGTQPISAKQFILEKEPRTDVERIACPVRVNKNETHGVRV